MTDTKKGLSSDALKLIAIIAMLTDHIAWAFVPSGTTAAIIMHAIGRLTAPIMCYFIAEGYHHTRNVRKYMARLGIFAVISQIPFLMAESLSAPPILIGNGNLWVNPDIFSLYFNVYFTLFLGLVALHTWKTEGSIVTQIFSVIGICFIATIGDWMFFSVLWILFFGIYRNDIRRQTIAYYCVAFSCMVVVVLPKILVGTPLWQCLWVLGLLFPPLLFSRYNGKRGNSGAVGKWFFYLFYPLHLLVIGIIKLYF